MSDEIPEECYCCGSEGVDLESYPGRYSTDTKWLCTLCAGTLVGTWMDAPTTNTFEYGKIMCFIGNEIIKAIRKTS